MGRRKKTTIEMPSLFDDSFFEETSKDGAEKPSSEKQVSITAIPQNKNHEGREPSPSNQPGGEPEVRLRGKKQNIRVTLPDGTVICGDNATQTMIETINAIGPAKVASVGMELCHVPLVSQTVSPKYAEWTKPLADGWHLMTQSNNHSKYMQLRSILAQLGIDAKVEMGDRDVVRATNPKKKEMTRKRTDGLRVTFKDGLVIQKDSPIRTFQAVVEYLGEDKVRKTNLKISGRDIISNTKNSNSQLQLSSGHWLSLPLSTKDKYRILRVLSSMTHTPFDVKILSNN